MRPRYALVTALLAISASFAPRFAWAQPDVGAQTKAANPANIVPLTPEQVRQQGLAQAEAIMKMTPEQQKEAIRNAMLMGLKAQLRQVGLTTETEQDAVIECIYSQERERAKVREAAAKVFKLTQIKNDPGVGANIAPVMEVYLAAIDDAKVQRETAAKTLDEKIDFSHKPQIKAFLILSGIIGEAAWYTGDVQLLGSMGVASLTMGGFMAPAR